MRTESGAVKGKEKTPTGELYKKWSRSVQRRVAPVGDVEEPGAAAQGDLSARCRTFFPFGRQFSGATQDVIIRRIQSESYVIE